ncbi:MAG: undecaprenyl phosphate translocase family protein, partial [Spirochaetota bacterium]
MNSEKKKKKKKNLNWLEYIRTLLGGLAIGIANVIPGVSGGTFALVLGIYDKFIGAFDDISRWLTSLIRFLFTLKKANWEKHRAITKSVNWLWIFILFVGIISAILMGSRVITYFLENYPAQTYGLFFGLILASVVIPFNK